MLAVSGFNVFEQCKECIKRITIFLRGFLNNVIQCPCSSKVMQLLSSKNVGRKFLHFSPQLVHSFEILDYLKSLKQQKTRTMLKNPLPWK